MITRTLSQRFSGGDLAPILEGMADDLRKYGINTGINAWSVTLESIPYAVLQKAIKIKLDKFSECFTHWINTLYEITKGEVVAIDGKTIRKSNDKSNGKCTFHVISAYATTNNVCPGQQCVDEKSNEITAIPKLLNLLIVRDSVIIIDAMGCQKDIAGKIIKNEADYVLKVREGQK